MKSLVGLRFKQLMSKLMCLFTGQKYEFALKWKLKIVRSEWLYESIEKGFCQDETKYEVKSQPSDKSDKRGMKTSTPERRSMAAGKLGLGAIPNKNMSADIQCI